MRSILHVTSLFLCAAVASASELSCPSVCAEFAYESGDMAICSSTGDAQIWNTTSGECHVNMDASLEIVSYMSLIFTVGVTPAVRSQIGNECWEYVPEKVAIAIVENEEFFESSVVCSSHPYNSPSLGWEMRYVMESKGYGDCASLIVIHEDFLKSCTRLHADARALATLAYMLAIAFGLVLFCCFPCWFFFCS